MTSERSGGDLFATSRAYEDRGEEFLVGNVRPLHDGGIVAKIAPHNGSQFTFFEE